MATNQPSESVQTKCPANAVNHTLCIASQRTLAHLSPRMLALQQQSDLEEASMAVDMSLPIRIDFALAIAYLFGPMGASILLMAEHRNDFIRLHSWQSLYLFTLWMALLSALSLWGAASLVIWGEVMLVSTALGLAWRAFHSAPSLKPFLLPFVGGIALRRISDEHEQ